MRNSEILIDVFPLDMVPTIDPHDYHHAIAGHCIAGATRAMGLTVDDPDMQLSLRYGGDIYTYNIEFVGTDINSTTCLLVRQPTEQYPEFYVIAVQCFVAHPEDLLIAPVAAMVSGVEDDDRVVSLYTAILRAILNRRNERLVLP